MKAVLSGDEAIARGAWEAGVRVAAAYPGTPSTEIMETCGRYKEIRAQWSINEKVALETAGGAAIGGARALCAMKHVGLNVAADPLFTLSYTGVNGGLVIVSADDPEMHSSQNEQDNRHYARAAKVPMLEPSDSAEALAFVKAAFELSEAHDAPVLLRVTTRICHAQGVVELGERQDVPLRPYEKNFAKYVMLPVNARKRHPVVEARTAALRDYGLTCPYNRIEPGEGKIGYITSGVAYSYVREAFPAAPVLKYGLTFPLNVELARTFAADLERVYVVEEGDPYLEEQLKAAGVNIAGGKDKTGLIGELNADRVRLAFGETPREGLKTELPIPARPPALCAGCSHRGVFTALKQEKATVFGDIGCYTLAALPPISTMDTCICMGASISASIGMAKARAGEERRLACAIGDSTFMHSGVTGLIDAVHNKAPFVVCILDNRVTAMTGHQNNPVTGKTLLSEPTHKIDLVALVKACGVRHVDEVDAWDIAGMRAVLQKHWAYDEVSVVITRRECVEWARTKESPYRGDRDLCVGCRQCATVGCPAVIFDADLKKSSIDEALCVGCSLCAQMCKFQAIYRSDREEAHQAEKPAILAERAAKKAEAQKRAQAPKKGGRP
ncbi:MAG: indolepyruvate ferredoxin oxidoreductase subunit alpha [Myxococcales bacterium]|nr:MAG: indolepyruvate ferredoxin oxidoreductase subunit alpha [Myxococcales bacterium]